MQLEPEGWAFKTVACLINIHRECSGSLLRLFVPALIMQRQCESHDVLKDLHLVNAPLITQVKTTALGAVDPPLFRGWGQRAGHLASLSQATLNPHVIIPLGPFKQQGDNHLHKTCYSGLHRNPIGERVLVPSSLGLFPFSISTQTYVRT